MYTDVQRIGPGFEGALDAGVHACTPCGYGSKSCGFLILLSAVVSTFLGGQRPVAGEQNIDSGECTPMYSVSAPVSRVHSMPVYMHVRHADMAQNRAVS
jgi:hypothetical protein